MKDEMIHRALFIPHNSSFILSSRHAGLEARDTAGLETCATQRASLRDGQHTRGQRCG